MTDLALQLLIQTLHASDSAATSNLWVLDENLTAADISGVTKRSPVPLTLMCNRFDLQQQLAQNKVECTFSDFDFSKFENNSVDQLFYRVSKEKAVVHHVINQAYRILKPEGKLIIAGYKNEGVKTYIDKANKYLNGGSEKTKGGQSSHLAILSKGTADSSARLDDKNYTSLRELSQTGQSFVSKPGQFGWNKTDKGSEFLIQHLPELLNSLHKQPETLLDLGCGYGYLSLMAASLTPLNKITATDNNAAALVSCEQNLKSTDVEYQVIADNCAQSIRGRFDLILCNPPFHQGFAVENDLTQLFLEQTHKHLHAKGNALFVVNQFIPLERKANDLFEKVRVLAKNSSFTLIHCKR